MPGNEIRRFSALFSLLILSLLPLPPLHFSVDSLEEMRGSIGGRDRERERERERGKQKKTLRYRDSESVEERRSCRGWKLEKENVTYRDKDRRKMERHRERET